MIRTGVLKLLLPPVCEEAQVMTKFDTFIQAPFSFTAQCPLMVRLMLFI